MISHFFSSRAAGLAFAQPRTPQHHSEGHLRHLIQEYASDVHARALASAIITSGINALQRKTSHITSEHLIAQFDKDQNRSDLLKDALLDGLPGVTDLYASAEFDEKYQAAGRVLMSFHHETQSMGAPRAVALFQHVLQEIWRDSCRSAQFAIDELETMLSPDLPTIYVQNHNVLTGLLTGAINGLSPCFDANGSLYAPPLPQQRRWARRAVLQDCALTYGGETYRAYVRDASAGGLGLDRVPPLKRGATVEVLMDSGRSFTAIVAWSSGQSAGVTFAQPLAANDPLIWG